MNLETSIKSGIVRAVDTRKWIPIYETYEYSDERNSHRLFCKLLNRLERERDTPIAYVGLGRVTMSGYIVAQIGYPLMEFEREIVNSQNEDDIKVTGEIQTASSLCGMRNGYWENSVVTSVNYNKAHPFEFELSNGDHVSIYYGGRYLDATVTKGPCTKEPVNQARFKGRTYDLSHHTRIEKFEYHAFGIDEGSITMYAEWLKEPVCVTPPFDALSAIYGGKFVAHGTMLYRMNDKGLLTEQICYLTPIRAIADDYVLCADGVLYCSHYGKMAGGAPIDAP
jgi:hypothetical protein